MVGGYEQRVRATLAPVTLGGDRVAEVAFDHGEDRLDLPALAEVQAMPITKQFLHQSAVFAPRWPERWSAMPVVVMGNLH